MNPLAGLDAAGLRNTLRALNQDTNGDHVYSNDRALYGYIAQNKRLILPQEVVALLHAKLITSRVSELSLSDIGSRSHVADMIGDSAYIKDSPYLIVDNLDPMLEMKTLYINYLQMRSAGLDSPNAFAVSAFRVRWLLLGCLTPKSSTDPNPADAILEEIVAIDATNADYGSIIAARTPGAIGAIDSSAITTYFAEFHSTVHGSKWVVSQAEAVWATVEYMFRTRGHHFKDQYVGLICRIMKGNFMGKWQWPATVSMENVFHTAIHPFGIKALPILTSNFAIHGKLGCALTSRLGSSPAGTAAITTTAAALKALRTEPWYNLFAQNYVKEIDRIETFANTINNDKFSYHQAARLYGRTKYHTLSYNAEIYTISEAKSTVTAVAAVAQGFINAMDKQVKAKTIQGFTFENARSLERYAAVNPLQSLKIAILIENTLQFLLEEKDAGNLRTLVFPIEKAIEEEEANTLDLEAKSGVSPKRS
jgi:hypothetical protein